jgi:hypothetical protein
VARVLSAPSKLLTHSGVARILSASSRLHTHSGVARVLSAPSKLLTHSGVARVLSAPSRLPTNSGVATEPDSLKKDRQVSINKSKVKRNIVVWIFGRKPLDLEDL